MPNPSRPSYIRDPVEALERSEIQKLQLSRLQAGIERVATTVPFYRNRLGTNCSADDIRSLGDLTRLPFTTKSDLRDNYPFGLLAVPMKDVIRIHASSGTTGKPTVVAYTRNDIQLWSELMARSYAAAGVTADDVIHNAYGYGLFTGGLGFHYGAECLSEQLSLQQTSRSERSFL